MIDEKQPTLSTRDLERERLKNLFGVYVDAIGKERLPRGSSGILQIISVGCGSGYEAKPLLDILPKSKYTGIDFDSGSIRLATDSNDDLKKDVCEFRIEDGRIAS